MITLGRGEWLESLLGILGAHTTPTSTVPRTPETLMPLRSQFFRAGRGRRGSREAGTKRRQLHKAPKEESKDKKGGRKETKADREIPSGRRWERGAREGTDTELQT